MPPGESAGSLPLMLMPRISQKVLSDSALKVTVTRAASPGFTLPVVGEMTKLPTSRSPPLALSLALASYSPEPEEPLYGAISKSKSNSPLFRISKVLGSLSVSYT